MALVEQVAVPHRLERPPDRLDVVGLERVVRVVEVDPVADPLGQRVPVLEVLEHRLAALRVELGDAVALDVVLRLEAELLLDRDLDRQAVRVPAGLALDVVPGHRLVAREDVLEDAREHVVRAGAAVRGRRALVEHERRAALAVAQRRPEHVALAPAREHLLLQRGEGDVRRERLVYGAHVEARILGLPHGQGLDRGRRAARRRVRGAADRRLRVARGGPRRRRRHPGARDHARDRERARPSTCGGSRAASGTACSSSRPARRGRGSRRRSGASSTATCRSAAPASCSCSRRATRSCASPTTAGGRRSTASSSRSTSCRAPTRCWRCATAWCAPG